MINYDSMSLIEYCDFMQDNKEILDLYEIAKKMELNNKQFLVFLKFNKATGSVYRFNSKVYEKEINLVNKRKIEFKARYIEVFVSEGTVFDMNLPLTPISLKNYKSTLNNINRNGVKAKLIENF